MLQQFVAPLGEELIGDVAVRASMVSWRDADLRNFRKGRIVEGGIFLPRLGNPISLAEDMQGNDRLDGVEATIAAEREYDIAVLQAMIAQQPN
jgi:hypothetical protein